jgi:hypothetical protein
MDDTILRDAEGKPRISIFSIAHLGDTERMFFVSLLLNQMLGWMRSQSGTTSRRKWGNKPANATLSLEFSCDDQQANDILQAYYRAQGQMIPLTLPDLIWQGVSGGLLEYLQQSSIRLDWTFAEGSEPDVEWVLCGRSKVRVELVAELRV